MSRTERKTGITGKTMIAAVSAAAVMVYLDSDDSRLSQVFYKISSEKVGSDIRIAQISDLHSHMYGECQKEILSSLYRHDPDIVALTGDIFDDRLDPEAVFSLVDGIKNRFPCFYVTGNHECKSPDLFRIKKFFGNEGITVLDGRSRTIAVNGTEIKISGVDDRWIDNRIGAGTLESQLNSVDIQSDCFSVLLSHRPEMAEVYSNSHFDLILAGHAHGGQWRIPGVVNGLFAPNQGFFPKYAGGLYKLGEDRKMIVSRGLQKGNKIMPRICNRPELVYIDIQNITAD